MSAPSSRPVQLALLDASRGAAALWVVLVHATIAYVATGHLELLANPFYAITVQGQIGVGFFFVISGYCILATIFSALNRGGTIRQYIVARCRRIYPPFLVALGCAVLLHLVLLFAMSRGLLPAGRPPESPLDHGLGYWLANLTLLQLPAGYGSFLLVSWSLCFEIAFYVLAGSLWAVCALGGRRAASPTLLVTMLNICSLVSVLWATASPRTCPFPLDRWFQFGLGIAMFVLINRHALKLGRFLQLQAVLVIAAAMVHAWLCSPVIPVERFYSDRTLEVSILGFVAVILLMARFDKRIASQGWMSPFIKLGKISYSLYLIHMLPIPLVDAVLRRAGLEGRLYIINVAAQTLTALIAGVLFYRFVERRFVETRKRPAEVTPLPCQITA